MSEPTLELQRTASLLIAMRNCQHGKGVAEVCYAKEDADALESVLAEVSRLKADNDSLKAINDRLTKDEWTLVELFRSPQFEADGRRGDDRGLSPWRAAAETMCRLKADNERLRAAVEKLGNCEPIERVLLDELKADNERLTAELALWKPMTHAEAQAAYDAAEAVPLSEEEIERMVAFATDPANRLNNEEEAQLHVRYRKVCAANADLRATVAAREATIAGMREWISRVDPMLFGKEPGDAEPFAGFGDAFDAMNAALASDAGSSLLARLRAAEAVCEAFGNIVDRPHNAGEWEISKLVAAWRKTL